MDKLRNLLRENLIKKKYNDSNFKESYQDQNVIKMTKD